MAIPENPKEFKPATVEEMQHFSNSQYGIKSNARQAEWLANIYNGLPDSRRQEMFNKIMEAIKMFS